MEFTAGMIAEFLKGTVEGDPGVKVNTIARIEDGFPGALSFLANPKYEQYLYTTQSSVVLVNDTLTLSAPVSATIVRVADSYKAFAALLALYEQSKPVKKGIHSTAVIEPSAVVGKDVYLGPYVYVGENVVIGDNTRVYPHTSIGDNTKIGSNCKIFSGVKIYHECMIGNGCTVHAGSVIGADGFGFAPQSESEFMKIPQIGNVIVEDNVEIGANVCIDRATIGSTIIRKGVKLDNLIQIGHNVEIGENTVMAGQSGVAGSTKIGRNCMFAGQVGVTGHITVADGTKVGAQSGIAGAIKKPDSVLLGSPAVDYQNFMKSFVVFKKLPEIKSVVDRLERESKKSENQ
jgi:UDP-3-O-[3-hydroxymyristoyl] glucosamine N-acyltransferase